MPAIWPKRRFAVRGSKRSVAISQKPEPSSGPKPGDVQIDDCGGEPARPWARAPLEQQQHRARGERDRHEACRAAMTSECCELSATSKIGEDRRGHHHRRKRCEVQVGQEQRVARGFAGDELRRDGAGATIAVMSTEPDAVREEFIPISLPIRAPAEARQGLVRSGSRDPIILPSRTIQLDFAGRLLDDVR